MATGAGSKPANIPEKFDPRTATLREVIEMYVNEARNPTAEGVKPRAIKGFENNFQKTGLKEMLDEPVIRLFNGSFDGPENPLAMALNETAVGSQRDLISAVSVIEDNVKRRHTALKINEDFFTLADSVIKPPRSKKYTAKFGFNVYKVGGLVEALVEHVKQNPADKPVANAIIFGLNTGFRPSAFGGLPVMGFKEAGRPGGPPGIFLPVGFPGVKTDQAINVPLSRRSIAILQDQQEWNQKNLGLGNKASPIFFAKRVASGKDKGKLKAIGDGDINRVLKALGSSFGIKVSVTDIKTPEAAYLTSYDLRRITATAFNALGVSINNAGALQGRPYASNTEQARYIGDAPGVYGDAATRDINMLSNFYHDQYAQTLPGYDDARAAGQALSLNTTYFDSLERKFVDPTADRPLPVYIQPVEMTPELVGDDVRATPADQQFDPDKTKKAGKNALKGINLNNLKLGAGAAAFVAIDPVEALATPFIGPVGAQVLSLSVIPTTTGKDPAEIVSEAFNIPLQEAYNMPAERIAEGMAMINAAKAEREAAIQEGARTMTTEPVREYSQQQTDIMLGKARDLRDSKLAEMQASLQQNEYDGLDFGGINGR